MTAGPGSRSPATSRTRQIRRHRPNPQRRLAILLGVFAVVGVVLLGVLADLQVVRPERYRALGEQQLQRTVPIDAYRGSITDRSGFVLAMSTQSHQVVVDPTLIKDSATTAGVLAPVLGRDVAELTKALDGDSETDRYQLLARQVADNVADQLDALRSTNRAAMVGVYVLPDEQRVNPAGRLAANLVGATDSDLHGMNGIEKKYDALMTGLDGSASFEGGVFGTISVGEQVVKPAEAGADITLTIDHRLQYVVDQALLEHCEAVQANGASAALSDPRTGELLALSSVVRDESGRCVIPGANLALLHTFEPGSVLKLVTMSGAVEELGLHPDSPIQVPSHVSVGGKTFVDDHPLPGGDNPMWKILAKSSNVGTISLSQRLGPDRLYHYLTAFGFGSPTGIGLEGEADGTVRAPQDWWGSDIGTMTIGQGITVNLVQLLAAYSTIANSGVYVAPSLVRSVAKPGEEAVDEPEPSHRVVSDETAAQVVEMLKKVVTDGTGKSAAIPGYEVAGKTGTAWKAVPNEDGVLRYTDDDGHRHYVVSFAGFVPADDPQLSMVVMVDEPRTQTMAATVAAPVFSRIMQHAVRILGIPPTTTVVQDTTELVRGTPAPLPIPGEEVRVGAPAEDANQPSGGNEPPPRAAEATDEAGTAAGADGRDDEVAPGTEATGARADGNDDEVAAGTGPPAGAGR